MTGRLEGKVAFITGGARGLGRAMSEAFAAEGAAVLMAGRSADTGHAAEEAIAEAGGRARFVTCDVADDAQVERAVASGVEAFGTLTTVVCNAGGGGGLPQGLLAEIDPAVWRDVLRVDLDGAFHTCRHALPHLVAAGGGSVLAIGSTVAVHGQRRIPAAVAAKLAVTGLMRSIAVDYGPDRVRANTLVLGLVPHDDYSMIAQGPIGEAFLKASALPFFGEPSDVAAAAVYLASDESRWVTGTELVVSGGISRAPDVLELLSAQLEALGPQG